MDFGNLEGGHSDQFTDVPGEQPVYAADPVNGVSRELIRSFEVIRLGVIGGDYSVKYIACRSPGIRSNSFCGCFGNANTDVVINANNFSFCPSQDTCLRIIQSFCLFA